MTSLFFLGLLFGLAQGLLMLFHQVYGPALYGQTQYQQYYLQQ